MNDSYTCGSAILHLTGSLTGSRGAGHHNRYLMKTDGMSAFSTVSAISTSLPAKPLGGNVAWEGTGN